jgi:tRNA(fMet)-specific endonuclease VapC
MPLRYLLDTNICIYIAKRRPEEVLARFLQLSPGEVAMSVITHGELYFGACKSGRREEAEKALDELATMVPVLPLISEVGFRYGEIRSVLERSGCLIGNNDLWIAAHAMALGVPLVTNNDREFTRVIGLEVLNWAAKKPDAPPHVHEATRKYGTRRRRWTAPKPWLEFPICPSRLILRGGRRAADDHAAAVV